MIALTQVMAVELAADHIRVNAVAPGPVETPLVKTMHTDEARSEWIKVVPQRRYAAPEEIAGTTGQYDYFIKVAVAGAEGYERFLRDRLYKIPGMRQTRSSFTLRCIKRNLSISV